MRIIFALLLSLPLVLGCGLDVTPQTQSTKLGDSVRYKAIVTANQKDTFTIRIDNQVRYWSRINPENLSLAQGEQGVFYIDVDAVVLNFPDIPISAYNSTDRCNTAQVYLNVQPKERMGLFRAPELNLIGIMFVLLLVAIYLRRRQDFSALS